MYGLNIRLFVWHKDVSKVSKCFLSGECLGFRVYIAEHHFSQYVDAHPYSILDEMVSDLAVIAVLCSQGIFSLSTLNPKPEKHKLQSVSSCLQKG